MEKNRKELHGNGKAEVAGMAIERLRFVDEGVDGGLGWKDVEERFDRLAKVSPGPVPVVNAVDFGYCIGEHVEVKCSLLRRRFLFKDDISLTKNYIQIYNFFSP
ncbi:hypothetical protein ACSBR2_041800 [Camellia fascicularis]